MNRKIIIGLLSLAMLASLCTGCMGTKTQETTQKPNSRLDISKEVVLNVCGGWPDCVAIKNAAQAFNKIYLNCTLQYEYLQNYDESLVKRLSESLDTVDLFFSTSGQGDSPYFPYQQDLYILDNIEKIRR